MKTKSNFISIGVITKAHGIKGEVMVSPLIDRLDQFKKNTTYFVRQKDEKRIAVTLQHVRTKKNQLITKFVGIDNRNQAEELRSGVIEMPRKNGDQLSADEYHIVDLIDLNVFTTTNQRLGIITDVLTLSANDVFVVQGEEKEYLIPAIKNVIKKVDLEKEIMVIDPIDGLLE